MEPFIAQIMLFSGNFAPRGWVFCDGQTLPIVSNEALFSLIDTTYGGDGRTTFALPDLRGRAPIHAGTGPGLSPRHAGQQVGSEHVMLTSDQTSTHIHSMMVLAQPADNNLPTGDLIARSEIYTAEKGAWPELASETIANAGGAVSLMTICSPAWS